MRALKQDAKEKRYGRICVLLGIILLGTVGCSHTVSDTPSIDAEIAEFLQVSGGVSVGRNPDNRPALTGREDHGSRPAGVRE